MYSDSDNVILSGQRFTLFFPGSLLLRLQFLCVMEYFHQLPPNTTFHLFRLYVFEVDKRMWLKEWRHGLLWRSSAYLIVAILSSSVFRSFRSDPSARYKRKILCGHACAFQMKSSRYILACATKKEDIDRQWELQFIDWEREANRINCTTMDSIFSPLWCCWWNVG